MAKLFQLKEGPQRGIRNWRLYVTKFLYNKASNFVRNQRRERKQFPFDELTHSSEIRSFSIGQSQSSFCFQGPIGFSLEFAGLWDQLNPALRHLWILLLQENGNQTRLAKRLGKHRNTIRSWLHEIERALEAHGFYGRDGLET